MVIPPSCWTDIDLEPFLLQAKEVLKAVEDTATKSLAALEEDLKVLHRGTNTDNRSVTLQKR